MESSSLTYLLVFYFYFLLLFAQVTPVSSANFLLSFNHYLRGREKAAFLPLQFFCFEPAKQQ